MTKNQIIKEIRRRCESFGVIFDLRDADRVEFAPGLLSAGYFDEEDKDGPKLVIAKDLEENSFLGILCHEYSHVTQWVENCTIWQEFGKAIAPYDMDGWLNTNRKCSDGMRRAFAVMRDMEADCERRTVRLIKELGAPIDLPNYIQRANAYIHFYNTIADTNRWYHPLRVPYNTPHVNALFPSDKIENSFAKTSKVQYDALVTCADLEHKPKRKSRPVTRAK